VLGRGLADESRRADHGFADPSARVRLLPEQFLALEHDPDGERDERDRAHPDSHVDQQQLASDDPADKNPDSDDNQGGTEPDHL
jgi:hypothetical protein